MRLFFKKALEDFGLSIGAAAEEKIWAYWELLKVKNENLNLISAKQTEEERVPAHLFDSLTPLLLPELSADFKALDIGSGGGLPALPLSFARPAWHYTLAEATRKKASFLIEVKAALKLDNIEIRNEYIEPLKNRENIYYDLISARAVTALSGLAELAGPRLRLGGLFLAMKGPKGQDELKEAANVLKKQGLKLRRSLDLTIPLLEARRVILLFEKIS